MVSDDTVAKLADFGESKRFDTKQAKEDADFDGDDALTMTPVVAAFCRRLQLCWSPQT